MRQRALGELPPRYARRQALFNTGGDYCDRTAPPCSVRRSPYRVKSNRSSILVSFAFSAQSCSARSLLSRRFSASRAVRSSKQSGSGAIRVCRLPSSFIPIVKSTTTRTGERSACFLESPLDARRRCGTTGWLSWARTTGSARDNTAPCCFFGSLAAKGIVARAPSALRPSPLSERRSGGMSRASPSLPAASFDWNR